jgi:lysyl-tRNA synthetase, class II
VEGQDEQTQVRLQKLQEMRAHGLDPFAPERFERTHLAAVLHDEFASLEGQRVVVAGRIVALRVMGKASFLHLDDDSGRIQIYCKLDTLGPEGYARLNWLDLGDHLGVEGELFRTRTGEVTVAASAYTPLSKSLRPLPFGKQKEGQEWYTLSDVEMRYRQRYADLAVHPEVRRHFRDRSRVVTALRRFLEERLFLEVETPVLQSVAGGAAARPFMTHHNALDHDFKLRISLELPLKRLIVGGFERVYEIGRVFRNEGIDSSHNPEFTLLELYQAYTDLEGMMDLVESLVPLLAKELHGRPEIPYQGGAIDLTPPWRRLPMLEGIREYAGVDPAELTSFDSARGVGERLGLDVTKETHLGGLIEKLHERFVQPHLVAPTFVTDYPLETSPLARRRADNPALTRRFEAFVATQELGNAFSEINDPLDQRERFQMQAQLLEAGEAEAHPMDEDFLRALEYGMPPTGGLGIGIDRLVMILTDTESVRDVILFPQMKPERG